MARVRGVGREDHRAAEDRRLRHGRGHPRRARRQQARRLHRPGHQEGPPDQARGRHLPRGGEAPPRRARRRAQPLGVPGLTMTTPERTCVGCGEKLPATALVRLRLAEGGVVRRPGAPRRTRRLDARGELLPGSRGEAQGLREGLPEGRIGRRIAAPGAVDGQRRQGLGDRLHVEEARARAGEAAQGAGDRALEPGARREAPRPGLRREEPLLLARGGPVAVRLRAHRRREEAQGRRAAPDRPRASWCASAPTSSRPRSPSRRPRRPSPRSRTRRSPVEEPVDAAAEAEAPSPRSTPSPPRREAAGRRSEAPPAEAGAPAAGAAQAAPAAPPRPPSRRPRARRPARPSPPRRRRPRADPRASVPPRPRRW